MIRRPPRSTQGVSSAASDVYKRQLEKEIKKRGLPANFLEDLMSEVGDSKEDVRELPIYNKVQKAVYNRLHGHIEDYDRRMDTILSELKDEFRDQLV